MGDAEVVAGGLVSGALSLDGVDDFVEVSDSPALNTPDGLTLDAWVNPADLSADGAIVSKYDSGTPGMEQVSWYLGHLAGGYLRFTVCNQPWGPENCTGVDTDDPVLNEGCWNLVTATYNKETEEAKIYVDNVDVPDTLNNLEGTVTLIADSEAPVRVGTFTPASGVNENFWDGLIDELEIYNRALSDLEIAGIYNAGASGKCKPDP